MTQKHTANIHRSLILTGIIALCLTGCINKNNPLNSSTGKTNEILIVADNQLWQSPLTDTTLALLHENLPCIPQAEPRFSTIQIPTQNFSNIYQPHRNILMFMKEDNPAHQITLSHDQWSQPQTIIRIYGKNAEQMAEVVGKYKNEILQRFNESERQRIQKAYRPLENPNHSRLLSQTYHLQLLIPNDYFIAKQTEDFIWFRKETKDFSLGIFLHISPYTNSNQFSLNNIIALRDSLTQAHIFGPAPGSFMKTSNDPIPPQQTPLTLNNNYAIETRGLWKMQGDFMGGPYIHYTLVDTTTRQLINIDGYTYAPNLPKRDLLRQIEALLHTLAPLKPETPAQQPAQPKK